MYVSVVAIAIEMPSKSEIVEEANLLRLLTRLDKQPLAQQQKVFYTF
jgi:hypothetical protein